MSTAASERTDKKRRATTPSAPKRTLTKSLKEPNAKRAGAHDTKSNKKAPATSSRQKVAAGTPAKKQGDPSRAKKTNAKTVKTNEGGNLRNATTRRSVRDTYEKLALAHPDAHCELDHTSPFELVVATALSAQSTDVQVNRVTPDLFKKFPTPEKLARAEQAEVEECVNRLGMFRQKAKNLIGLAKKLVSEHGGEVPADQAKLVELPGVGRKTANVVLGVAFQAPVGVVVDTHVQRITQRLGWTKNTTPEKIERDLMDLLPSSEWDRVSHILIFHGRRICSARKPACSTCPVNKECPSAFHAEEVGRKPKKVRAR